MERFVRDVIIHEIRARRFRMAVCVMFLPRGYAVVKATAKARVEEPRLSAYCGHCGSPYEAGHVCVVNPNYFTNS